MELFNSLDSETQLAVVIAAGFILFFIIIPILYRFQRKFMYRFWGTYWALKRFIRTGGPFGYRKKVHHIPNQVSRPQSSISSQIAPKHFVGYANQAPQKEFTPWKEDYRSAYILWFIGIAWMIGVMFEYRETQNYYLPIIAMLCVAPIYLGFSYLQSGQSRKRGKDIEIKTKQKLQAILPVNWIALPDRLMETSGDIDVSIQLPNGEICVIEIKSWNYWSGFVRKIKAISQVHRQRRTTGAAYGIIWLPVSRKVYEHFEGNVLIASGPAKSVLTKITKTIQHPTVIRFPQVPSGHIRRFIKAQGFMWNKYDHSWNGKCSWRQFETWHPKILHAGGGIVVSDYLDDE